MKKAIIIFFKRVKEHNIFGMSAKTAYYLILSFFPLALLMLSAISKTNTRMFKYIMPPFVIRILDDVVKISPDIKITTLSFVIVLWSASTAIWALMDGIHLAYTGRMHDRLKNGRLRAILFTLFLVIFAFICVSVTFIGSININFSLLFSKWLNLKLEASFPIFHMTVVFICIFLFIVTLYAMTPCVKIKLRKTFLGVCITSISWLLATWGFDIYMTMFNNYSVLYGSVGAFLGLSVWLYTVTLVLFLGAELNAVLLKEKS